MVQVGSTGLPIIVIPRINGLVITQDEIKTKYSNSFVDDVTTPLNFILEYKSVDGDVITQVWDSAKSSESSIYFPVPDSIYANKEEWTIAIAWQISTEKNYSLKPFHLTVDDVHNR